MEIQRKILIMVIINLTMGQATEDLDIMKEMMAEMKIEMNERLSLAEGKQRRKLSLQLPRMSLKMQRRNVQLPKMILSLPRMSLRLPRIPWPNLLLTRQKLMPSQRMSLPLLRIS